ncbi:enoyl-CoA hydratase/isomerase family protein [Egicoccus sp. AB-alg6-2]|uniref:enoyl-CoA hydratase/isomerase family protein n=1 Tax=Egicoccus sp. AB-alg6-2 TaxID=3242692 RepID=UPI00359DA6E7
MGEFVRLEVDAERRVGTIRMDRPPMNAISDQVWLEIGDCAQEAADHPDVGAIVVWGGPKVFAAGADIKDFPDYDYQAMKAGGGVLQRSLDTLARVPLVTIAVVNGYALGGGCEVALACDFRFAADNAKLGQPEVLLGLIPGAGGTQRLPRLVGLSRAKELLFSGRMVDMVEAQQIGLVDQVHPADEVYDRAVEAAARYAAGPFALRLIKQAVEEGTEMPLDQGLRLEQSLFAEAFGTDDATTGIQSFLANGPGKAEFTGR